MKTFEKPRMEVVYLSKEDAIRTSICYGVACPPYVCPDCVDCVGTFTCLSATCDAYGG